MITNRQNVRDSSGQVSLSLSLSLSLSTLVYLLHQLGYNKGNSVYWFYIGLKAVKFCSGTRGYPSSRPIAIVLWIARARPWYQTVNLFSNFARINYKSLVILEEKRRCIFFLFFLGFFHRFVKELTFDAIFNIREMFEKNPFIQYC